MTYEDSGEYAKLRRLGEVKGIIWMVGITVVFATLTIARYRRTV